jgi:predicted tellurium resistance membrane protein TerC
MGIAANLIARLLERRRWIAWIGLAIVLYVALTMIWHGGHEVAGKYHEMPDQLHKMAGWFDEASEWFSQTLARFGGR